jgi:hypothetical protein
MRIPDIPVYKDERPYPWYRSFVMRRGSTDGGIKKFIRQVLKNPTRSTRPVFLVGNGRSGTSMIVFQLAKAWEVALYNENDEEAFTYWHLKDYGVVEGILQRVFAPVALFKPIKDTYRVHTVLKAFPDARVLFIYRYYNDVINSSRKKFYEYWSTYTGRPIEEWTPPVDRWMADDFSDYQFAPPPVVSQERIRALWHPGLNLESKIALHWLFTNQLYFDLQLDQDPRVRLFQYEAVVQDPARFFPEICQFIEIGFMPEMIESVQGSSIGKNEAPILAPEIKLACEACWNLLKAASE